VTDQKNRKIERVLITGVSSGLGKALAAHYLAQGARVYGVARRTPQELRANRNFVFLSADLRSLSRISKNLETLLPANANLDLVILNAGILGEIKDMQQTSLDELREIFDINLWANKNICDFLMHRTSTRQVVAISSGAAVNGNRGWGGYSLSKAALNMLVKLYAAENPETHYSAVAPGLIDTAMQDYLCVVPDAKKYQALEKLRSARGTENMPTPEKAAEKLGPFFSRLPSAIESGSFTDIRTFKPGS